MFNSFNVELIRRQTVLLGYVIYSLVSDKPLLGRHEPSTTSTQIQGKSIDEYKIKVIVVCMKNGKMRDKALLVMSSDHNDRSVSYH